MADSAKKKKTTESVSKTRSGGTKKKTTTTVTKKKASNTKNVSRSVKTLEAKKVKEENKVHYIEKNVEPEEVLPVMQEVSETHDEMIESKKNNELREIPVSHYIIVGIIVVWILIFMYIGYKMTQNYRERLYDTGYFYHENIDIKKISLSEVTDVIPNSSSTFLFFNYRGIEETYDLEKEVYQIMRDYHLQDSFYYIDLTDIDVEKQVTEIREVLGIETLLHTPAILYYQDGNLIQIAQREDQKVLESADFVKVLDMYEFKK